MFYCSSILNAKITGANSNIHYVKMDSCLAVLEIGKTSHSKLPIVYYMLQLLIFHFLISVWRAFVVLIFFPLSILNFSYNRKRSSPCIIFHYNGNQLTTFSYAIKELKEGKSRHCHICKFSPFYIFLLNSNLKIQYIFILKA